MLLLFLYFTRMKRLLVAIVVFLNCLPLFCHAQNAAVPVTYISKDSLGSILELEKNWLYNEQDDSSFSRTEYNDSGWYLINRSNLPRVGKKKFPGDHFNSLAWFRLHFHTDSSLIHTPIALSIQQAGASEIYLDGKKIQQNGTINGKESVYHNPNGLPLVINVLPGNHVLAVRYANYDALRNLEIFEADESGFNISVYEANDIISTHAESKYSSILLCTFFLVFFYSFCTLHIILFIYNRSDKSNLYFSLLCFSFGSLFLTGIFNSIGNDPIYYLSSSYSIIAIGCLICFSLSGFVNTLYGHSKKRKLIIGVICFLPIILRPFTTELSFLLTAVIIVIAALEAIILNVKAIYNRVDGARIVGIGVLSLNILIVGVILYLAFVNQYLNLGRFPIVLLLTVLTFISVPISMSFYLSRNFALLNKSLSVQLKQVQTLSEKTIEQEVEKQKILENQKGQLEHEVAERTSELLAQKQKSDDLLLNILPEEVAEELKEKGTSAAKYFDHVSVLFTDFVDFTKAGERLTPQQLVDELHTCFKKFDEICAKYNIEKIKTIGDAYLAVCGLPMSDKEHAINITKAAIEIREFIAERKLAMPDTSFYIRIGIHSGSVVAGIVGVKKFAYDIWGDTVNTAARMEQSSESGKINVSQFTYDLIKDQFNCTFRGQITAKSKGEMNMYFVEGEK